MTHFELRDWTNCNEGMVEPVCTSNSNKNTFAALAAAAVLTALLDEAADACGGSGIRLCLLASSPMMQSGRLRVKKS